MKTEPTDLDREAARLFRPAGGMRAGWRGSRDGISPVWERLRDGSEATPDYLDADDAATVGCMLAQVDEVRAGLAVSIVDRMLERTMAGLPVARFAAYVADARTCIHAVSGPTRGAALVAVMRKLRGGVLD